MYALRIFKETNLEHDELKIHFISKIIGHLRFFTFSRMSKEILDEFFSNFGSLKCLTSYFSVKVLTQGLLEDQQLIEVKINI